MPGAATGESPDVLSGCLVLEVTSVCAAEGLWLREEVVLARQSGRVVLI